MSLTAEDLQAISDLMDKKLEPVNNRLDRMECRLDNMENKLEHIEERIEVIEENVEVVKGATEEIIEWFSTYQRSDPDKPFPARESDIKLKIRLDEEALKKT